jgi:ABC-type oligopeptide transport system substrate-binding subunit
VFERTVQEEKVQHKGEPFDITAAGWGDDYPDPYDFINILLSGKNIHETGNINTSYFDDPKWNKRMDQAAALPLGPKRYASYAALDRDLVAGPAPVAAFANNNALALLSNRIKTLVYHPIYGVNYTASELK